MAHLDWQYDPAPESAAIGRLRERYQLFVNGRFVDPMRIKLPRGRSLDGPLLANFEAERDRIDTTMANRPGGSRPPAQAAKGQKTAQAANR